MKLIQFDGRIGKDGAELKQTVTGKPYLRFSVANNSYVGGKEKVEWFDVKTFDPFVIENRMKVLTKGTYVIINGELQTDVNVDKNNKVWVNQYVTATTIYTPMVGSKKDKDDIVDMSSGVSVTTKNISAPMAPTVDSAYQTPEVEMTTGFTSDDDLPF